MVSIFVKLYWDRLFKLHNTSVVPGEIFLMDATWKYIQMFYQNWREDMLHIGDSYCLLKELHFKA